MTISEEELVTKSVLRVYRMPVNDIATGVTVEIKGDKISLFSPKGEETLK